MGMSEFKTFVTLRRAASLFLLAGLAPSLVACAAALLGAGAAGGVAGTAYVMGKLQTELDGSVPRVRTATVAGLKSLDLPVNKNEGDQFVATIESKTADDKQIWVTIDSLSSSRSKLTIRVGLLGDESRSRRILDAVKANL